MKILRKIVLIIFIFITILFLTISTYLQIKFENYFKEWKNESMILKNRTRNSYMPYSVFLIYHFVLKNREDLYNQNLQFIIHETNLNNTGSYLTHGAYDPYIVYVFLSKDESESFLGSNKEGWTEKDFWKLVKGIKADQRQIKQIFLRNF